MASRRNPPEFDPFELLGLWDPNRASGRGRDRSANGPPHPQHPPPPFPFPIPGIFGPPGSWDDWEQWSRGDETPNDARPTGRQPRREDGPRSANDNVNVNQAPEAEAAPAASRQTSGIVADDAATDTTEFPDPAEVTPDESEAEDAYRHNGRSERRGGGRGRGRGRGGRGPHHGDWHGHGHGHAHTHGHGHGHGPYDHRHGPFPHDAPIRGGRGGFRHAHPHHPPPPPRQPGHHHSEDPLDFGNILRDLTESFSNLHRNASPAASAAASSQNINRGNNDATRGSGNGNVNDNGNDDKMVPVDIFDTGSAYVLHVALAGVRKEDVGVTWDPDHDALRIAGVMHRPGDEALLRSLVSTERRVGLFERVIPLPPRATGVAASAKEEKINVDAIAAKMEDGLLVVTVPKVEKEWAEVRRVNIQ